MSSLVVSAQVQQRLSTTITYRIPEGIYVSSGSRAGLEAGMKGSLLLQGGRVFGFEVVQVTANSALLRLDGAGSSLVGSLQNLTVDLSFQTLEVPEEKDSDRVGDEDSSEPFVPLLAPPDAQPQITAQKNIAHGRIGIQQTYLAAEDDRLDYAVTRIDTAGSVDRLFGTGWSLIWSGNVRYRTGEGYEDHPEFETLQPLVYSAYLQHPLAGDGFARLGRFLPLELPGIGYIDGAQAELDSGKYWAFGFVGGLKPDRVNLDFSADEPTAAAYGTFEAGKIGATYFSGTVGLLGSVYDGEADRLALLFDERLGLGKKFNLFSSAEVDFGVANTTNAQMQLSRFDGYASYRFDPLFTLRAGADHWQRIDSRAERDALPFIVSDQLFDGGFWRYWVGGRHQLPWNLDLDEEVAYTVSEAVDDSVRWRVGLTRTSLFKWKTANVGATVYNLQAQGADGLGWLLRAYLPFRDGRISFRPTASMRWLDAEGSDDSVSLTYLALYADWMISKSWTLNGGLTATEGDFSESLLFDAGLRYTW